MTVRKRKTTGRRAWRTKDELGGGGGLPFRLRKRRERSMKMRAGTGGWTRDHHESDMDSKLGIRRAASNPAYLETYAIEHHASEAYRASEHPSETPIIEQSSHSAPRNYYTLQVSKGASQALASETTHSGSTLIALPPNLLWQTPHTRSSVMTTLLFLPPLPPRTPSPRRNFASSLDKSVLRRPATTRPSLTMVLAERILPRK